MHENGDKNRILHTETKVTRTVQKGINGHARGTHRWGHLEVEVWVNVGLGIMGVLDIPLDVGCES
jgi:hypothetical protein